MGVESTLRPALCLGPQEPAAGPVDPARHDRRCEPRPETEGRLLGVPHQPSTPQVTAPPLCPPQAPGPPSLGAHPAEAPPGHFHCLLPSPEEPHRPGSQVGQGLRGPPPTPRALPRREPRGHGGPRDGHRHEASVPRRARLWGLSPLSSSQGPTPGASKPPGSCLAPAGSSPRARVRPPCRQGCPLSALSRGCRATAAI